MNAKNEQTVSLDIKHISIYVYVIIIIFSEDKHYILTFTAYYTCEVSYVFI